MKVLALEGGLLVLIIAATAIYTIRTLESLRKLFESILDILRQRDRQAVEILENVKQTTQHISATTSRVDDAVRTVLAVPNVVENFVKQIFISLFKKEKREGTH